MNGPTARRLPDGRRLHLQHGPIDLIVEAFGPEDEQRLAYEQATARFETVLGELVGELALLRRPVDGSPPEVEGRVAQRMVQAVWPHRRVFVTPMAAVAGAVADEILAALVAARELSRAYVNNGGDVAVHLSVRQSFKAAVVDRIDAPRPAGVIELDATGAARGLATSGWSGRSLSLGIADAVTALARSAAAADAAATLIANAVDADHPSIRRRPARDLRDDSDLGDLPATVRVGELPREVLAEALDRGAAAAEMMHRDDLVTGARLALQGVIRRVGTINESEPVSDERLRPAS
ncbi:MAG: UPF0280 family protein, partial [Geminicoccaceae bacterium]|nr:UPF0280 family protein [Geminicoccaceae bacterium]